MTQDDNNFGKWSRRDMLRGLAGIPILGTVWFAGAKGTVSAKEERQKLLETLNIKASPPPPTGPMSGDPIRIGIIGFGIRGEQLCRALGYATTDWLQSMKEAAEKNPNDTRLKDFQAQENLNLKMTAVCDIFDYRAQKVVDSFTTDTNKVKRFLNYKELIHSKEVDAIVIATPDHWHAPIAIEAINAGVHVYIEKPMTHKQLEDWTARYTRFVADKAA